MSMGHPAWKRTYAIRALKLRRKLSDAELCRRLRVPPGTMDAWLYGRKTKRLT